MTLNFLTWQIRRRNVLSVLVGQLLESSQPTAVAYNRVCRNPMILKQDQMSDKVGTGKAIH